MRVEYKNPEILKRPDSRITIKDIQGIWEPDTKTLRIYYEGNLSNIPRSIVSIDGDEILELILEDSDSTLGNCGNIIYIEFPESTEADIVLSGASGNITYLESRGYAIGENILRGITTPVEAKLRKFISKASWYRYFRINRVSKTTNLKRLDWAGRSISRDYYERCYSNLQLFCDGADENDLTVYDFGMNTPCITFYGFAVEEVYRVEGNNRTLVSKEIVSLENVPGLVISELPGGTQNFVLSIDSEHLRAELLTIPDFNPEETNTVYHTSFIAEVYDSLGQKNTSYPLEITTYSARLSWYLDLDRTTTIFREDGAPVFLFRYNDSLRGAYHTLRVSTIKTIENTSEVSVGPDDSASDPYFVYEKSFCDNQLGGTDIIIKIKPTEGFQNLTDSWVPKLYGDFPEPRKVSYRNHELVFYAIIGPKNDDLYLIEPGPEDEAEEAEIEAFEFPNDILGGNYIVKTTGNDTYWSGFATNPSVYATAWGYTGYVKPETPEEDISTDTSSTEDKPSQPEPPKKKEVFNFDIPGSDTSGITSDGLLIFPSSACVRPGQVFMVSSVEIKGSSKVWCRDSRLGRTVYNNTGVHRVESTSNVPSNSVNCYEAKWWAAPSTPGTYNMQVIGIKDKNKKGTFKLKVVSDEEGKYAKLYSTYMVAFKTTPYKPSGADVFEAQIYNYESALVKVYAYYKDDPTKPVLVDFTASDCDFTYKITKSGIIKSIDKTTEGLRIFRGSNYGVTELIIYSKSDPSMYLDIPVFVFGDKAKYYQSSIK